MTTVTPSSSTTDTSASTATGPFTPTLESGQVTMPDNSIREYAFLRPDPTVADPVPLLLVFHGGGGNPRVVANQFGFLDLQRPLPFLTVFPQGTDVSLADPTVDAVWNSGQSYLGSQVGADDVTFIDELLIDVTRRTAISGLRIDQFRTYACGFSNGAMMTYRLAAERSRSFAAIAVIAGSIGGVADPLTDPYAVHINDPALHDGDPVAVLHLHGLLDEGVSLYGGTNRTGANPRSDLPAADAVELWVANNRCQPLPQIESTPFGTLRTWAGGDNDTEVKLVVMPGMGHQVPDFALDLLLPFFEAHSK